MSRLLSADPDRQGNTDISIDEVKRQSRERGWPFWRGVLIGFASAFAIAYLALSPGPFLFAN